MPTTGEVLIDRLRSGSRPGARADDYRVALVIEGGGMRGAVSAGVVVGLDHLGFRDAFDLVVGTSAGAIGGAFFVTGKGPESVAMYYDELNTTPFLSKKRLMRRGAALDVAYLIETAAPRRGLDFEAVGVSDVPLYATLTPVALEGGIELVRVDGDAERVSSILQATASLPVLAGESKQVDGEFYVDGGLTEQIPWRSATGLGATHILVAASRHVSGTKPRSAQNFLERMALPRVIKSMHGTRVAEVARTLPTRATMESWSLRAVVDGYACALTPDGQRWDGDIELIEIADGVELPERMETSRERLVDAVMLGAQAAVDHFGLERVEVVQQIVLTHPDLPGVYARERELPILIRQEAQVPDPASGSATPDEDADPIDAGRAETAAAADTPPSTATPDRKARSAKPRRRGVGRTTRRSTKSQKGARSDDEQAHDGPDDATPAADPDDEPPAASGDGFETARTLPR